MLVDECIKIFGRDTKKNKVLINFQLQITSVFNEMFSFSLFVTIQDCRSWMQLYSCTITSCLFRICYIVWQRRLCIIRVYVYLYSMSVCYSGQWQGIDDKHYRSEDRLLWHPKQQNHNFGQSIFDGYTLTPYSEIWTKPKPALEVSPVYATWWQRPKPRCFKHSKNLPEPLTYITLHVLYL